MLSEYFDLTSKLISSARYSFSPAFVTALSSFTAVAFLWLIWRLWRFTIVPRIWPQEPQLLPYKIPLLGHTVAAIQDQQGLMQYANQHFQGDSPFALTIGGSRFIILRNPSDLKTIWNDTKSLTFDNHIQGIFSSFGIPESRYNVMFQANPAQFWHGNSTSVPHFIRDNSSRKRYLDVQETWLKEQLQPGEKMELVSKRFLGAIDTLISTSLTNPNIVLSTSPFSVKTVSIYNWGRYVLCEAGNLAFLGPEIYTIDPEFTNHYIEFENLSWKIAHGHPDFLSRDMQRAREVLVQTIMKYYELESGKREGLSWLFGRLRNEQLELGLNLHDVASFGLILLWGVHLNTYRMLFWTLTHILSSPSLTQTIITETAPFYKPTAAGTPSFSITHLSSPIHCPILNATWHEALRLYASSAVVRSTSSSSPMTFLLAPSSATSPPTSNTTQSSPHKNRKPPIQKTLTIHPTDTLLTPFHLLHLSPTIFGPSAPHFNPHRWLSDPNLNLRTSSVKGGGFHPFGGGHMHCPGRMLAKQEVLLFVAVVLGRFEVVPVGEREELEVEGFGDGDGEEEGKGKGEKRWRVPEVKKVHVLATLDPVEDFVVRVRERESPGDGEGKAKL